MFIVGLFVLAELFSIVTPPFQSPDEFSHVKRAYLLGKGIVLVNERRLETGGLIDEGLLYYMSCFSQLPFDYTKKGGRQISPDCQSVGFARSERFSGLPNTALYFPLPYLPQALALISGEHLGWRLATTYYLARFLALVTTLGILWWAFFIYPAPPVSMALLILPMSVFQLASASLDAVTFALSALVAALFLRGMNKDRAFNTSMHAALALVILLLATSRIVYVSLVLLLFTISWRRRSWPFAISGLVVVVLSLSWFGYVLKNVHELDAHVWGGSGLSSTAIAMFYLRSPGSLAAVFWRTLSDSNLLLWHWRSFVGILGWLDTPLDSGVYLLVGMLLLSIATISVIWGKPFGDRLSSTTLAVTSLVSLFLVFFLALVGWTAHPANTIYVQGRYFYPPGILLAYAMAPRVGTSGRKLSLYGAPLMAIICVADAIPKLLYRYH